MIERARHNKRARKHISLREKLAAALSMLLSQAQRDQLRAAMAPARKVIGLFDMDHVILHALDGSDKWWNLTPMLRAAHREKAARDTSIVAKVRRISPAEEAHREAMRRKLLAPTERTEHQSRLRGGGFRQHPDLKRNVSGKVVPRRQSNTRLRSLAGDGE